MTQLPNNFGSLRQPDGRRLDMNFQAIRDSLVGTDASAASLAARVTDLETPATALCVASRSSQTILHNTATAVVLDTLVDGDSSWLNVSNGRITPDVPGRYDVGCTWNYSAGGFPANSRIIAQIRKNGTYVCGTDLVPISGSPDGTIRNHKPVQMNGSTDYFDILVYHFQGTGTTARDVVAEMGVWLIHRDDSLA